jgi:4-hydroxy-3-polyprenylbenzoate decarboxylase
MADRSGAAEAPLAKRLIVGITGASGVVYGERMLRALRGIPSIETHLILTRSGRKLVRLELRTPVSKLERLAAHCYDEEDLEAPVASGTFLTGGMVIIPCSIKTLSAVVSSFAHNLLTRAADVALKERRPLVLVVRETPLHSGHLELMLRASRLGAVVMPASPGFYGSPRRVEDLVDHVVGKALDALGIENRVCQRWKDT